jgi:DNA-binding response OmpR family regulator
MKILIVEDEAELLSAAKAYLGTEGHICEGAPTVDDAVDRLSKSEYDCIIIDIGLPDGNGLDIIGMLKQRSLESGIIIISAKNGLEDKLIGLELGADDYLTKPFHLAELNARIKSVLRRRKFNGSKEINFNEISINPDLLVSTVNGARVVLTKKEFDLLVFFIANRDKVLTKESIVEHLWGDYANAADSYDFVYTHISNLKKKLVERGGRDYLKSVYGVGYKFTDI